jgi:hypothetical protein
MVQSTCARPFYVGKGLCRRDILSKRAYVGMTDSRVDGFHNFAEGLRRREQTGILKAFFLQEGRYD